MNVSPAQLDAALRKLDAAILALASGRPSSASDRWRADAAAARFHLRRDDKAANMLVVLGGTGTGKSTLVNRLINETVSASSFRRTFTAGAVAVTADAEQIPQDWLGVEHVTATDLPARGRDGTLTIVLLSTHDSALKTVLVDTPDLDGDTPAHHAQADRAFRWATAVLFVVTPEKYQMNELLPYYRLARRYGLPALFTMNKCEEQVVLDDYRRLLAERDWPDARVFAAPRDDAAYEPAVAENLSALRDHIKAIPPATQNHVSRATDLLRRLQDQIIGPGLDARRAADAAIARVRALETPPPGVDVNPLTQQLQRRLQQRSVLYLIGPQRMLDRVRQVPSLLARLPRAAWDYVAKGELPSSGGSAGLDAREVPDFRAMLIDQFNVVRSRVDDLLQEDSQTRSWLNEPSYTSTRLPDDEAGRIADEELAELRKWLEHRWNADPRDTRMLRKMLKHLPGGEKLTQWSESAPYLLAIVLATHHAFFGHVDLLILGGYSIATWLTERVSNEVASRTRQTNVAISDRFTALAHRQINAAVEWLNSRAPSKTALSEMTKLADGLADQLGSVEIDRNVAQ